MAKKKISKEKSNYVDKAQNGRQPCKDCGMFFNHGACSLVEGKIAPGGHCKYWVAKNKLPIGE